MSYVHNVAGIDPADTSRFGGKATGLGRMIALGLPVPPAFVIDTDACRATGERGGRLPEELADQVTAALVELQASVGRVFAAGEGRSRPDAAGEGRSRPDAAGEGRSRPDAAGEGRSRPDTAGEGPPLLLSVRSGAQVSMPGMMDTVLNLGLDRASVLRLAQACRSDPFAVDCWLRFWAMYSDIVLDVDPELLREEVEPQRAAAAAALTPETAAALEDAITAFLDSEGVQAPTDPRAQLDGAIRAVFKSWDSRRARTYRDHHGIPHDLGTAVTVQAMVFGNLDSSSGSGVAFSRDPKSGQNELYGEYLPQGQGEEVVAGTRTPVDLAAEKESWADLRAELIAHGTTLEAEYRDALDIEFTVESGKLYLLQVRPAKRTASAAVRIAVDLTREGLITAAEAMGRVTAEQVRRLVSPQFDTAAVAEATAAGRLLFTGIPASPGHGSGVAVLDADRAAERTAEGVDVVLLRPTTSPQDLRGMLAATAVVTARGGATSHAAVVSRALDKPCVVGVKEVDVRPDERVFLVGDVGYPEGIELSVDGATGNVFAGILPRSVPDAAAADLGTLLDLADDLSGAAVWLPVALAGTAREVAHRGAAGIGVVGLTDLLGGIPDAVPRMVEAIEALGLDAAAPEAKVEDLVREDVRTVVRGLLESAGNLPVDLRLPVFTSPRARRLISEWSSLAPHLLLPLGPRRLLVAWLAAIAEAVEQTGHAATTVLLGGVTHPAEIDAFVELLAAHPALRAGAVLGNPTVLFAPDALVGADRALWVDLHELTRAAHGYPEELMFTISELTHRGAIGEVPPGTALNPLVGHLVAELFAAAGAGAGRSGRVGVDLSGASAADIVGDLYRLGVRTFTSVSGGAEELRLLAAQAAGGATEARSG
ncbi:MAG: PEP/pyruvate-binding domain-containing protein [Sporichthyaceae bacterium]